MTKVGEFPNYASYKQHCHNVNLCNQLDNIITSVIFNVNMCNQSENIITSVIYRNANMFNQSENIITSVIVEKLLPFKSLYFACKRKLSKTSRLLRLAATGNCPDRMGCVTARLTTAITCDTDSRQTSGHPAHAIGAVASSSQTKET